MLFELENKRRQHMQNQNLLSSFILFLMHSGGKFREAIDWLPPFISWLIHTVLTIGNEVTNKSVRDTARQGARDAFCCLLA